MSFAEVRFLNYADIVDNLRRRAAEAKAVHPEICRVLLFGSLVEGNWTADSDADLLVVVRHEFHDFFERSRYQIHSRLIPTDTLVYSEDEFQRLAADPTSLISSISSKAMEL